MKKIFLYTISLLFILTAITSCGDNTDFWGLHTLTDAEIAELTRQDSIKNAQLENIDANLILKYNVDITISSTSYDGTSLAIDVDQIAALFGITTSELLAGIAGDDGAPEVKGFAIEGTTHADNMTTTNTGAYWGHWWDANGDVINWGDGATLYAEFDTDAGTFYVGQYPGRLSDGDSIKFIEALKYNNKRVAIVITAIAHSKAAITATVVNTQNLSIDVNPKSVYNPDSLAFDLSKTLTDLGVSSMDEVSFVGVNADGSYASDYVTNNGFWYDMTGYVGSWGDDASVYTDYGDFGSDKISIGQYPGHLTAGQTLNIKYGIMANNKIEMLNITINVIAYQDPETPPTGDPVSVTETIVMSKAYSNDYASVDYDVKDILRNAFKKTTYQIFQAIESGDLKLYQGAVSETDPTYTTADTPGYWLDATGTACEWASGYVYLSLGHSETELYLYGGNHPDNCAAGTTVNTVLIAAYNGVKVTFNITFNVQ